MANMQYALDPLNYATVGPSGVYYTAAQHVAGTSGSFDPLYPASNILDVDRPRRYSRTTTSGTTRWGIDLGTTRTLAAITIENTNMNDVFIKGGTNPDGVTYSVTQNFPIGGGSFATDGEDGRKKHLCVLSGFTGVRYIQIGPQTNPGDGYYQLGAVGIWVTLTTLNKNFSTPYEKTALDDAEEFQFLQGGREISLPQPIAIQFALQARVPRTDTTGLAQYRALANYRRDKVLMLYENNSDLSKVYHVRRSGSFRMTRTESATYTFSGMQFLEVI